MYIKRPEQFLKTQITQFPQFTHGTPRVECNDLLFVINAVDGSVIDPAKGY